MFKIRIENSILSDGNFILFWVSTAIAHTGIFFTIVALPWLILEVTGNNPFTMTVILSLMSLPQGLCILFGGAISDKFSPEIVLVRSRIAYCVLLIFLSLIIFFGFVPIKLIACFAIAIGFLGGLSLPATQALLPRILRTKDLSLGNGIVMGTAQLAQIFGPVLAGWLIWLGRTLFSEGSGNLLGISMAFAGDALMIFVSILILNRLKTSPIDARKERIARIVKQGFSFCFKDKGIRIVLFYIVSISFFIHGPLHSALPLFTKLTLGLLEGSYGFLFAMMGVGTIIGALLSVFNRLDQRNLGGIVLTCDFISGGSLFLLGKQGSLLGASLCLGVIGICAGLIMVSGTTWFQARTPAQYMGRVMGVLMFCIVGFVPISSVVSGIIMKAYSIEFLLTCCGVVVMFLAGSGLAIPFIRNMGNVDPLEWKEA